MKNITGLWVDMEFKPGWFALKNEEHDVILCSTWEAAGIEDNDPMYQEKLDRFIENSLGYLPDYEIN